MAFKHRIENEQQAAHGRDQCDLGRFTASPQALIKGFEHWIAAHCGHRGDVEQRSRPPSILPCPRRVPLS